MASFTLYKDRAGEWRWTLSAANNRHVAASGEGYVNRSDCIDAVRLVKRDAPSAPVHDVSSGAAVTVTGV